MRVGRRLRILLAVRRDGGVPRACSYMTSSRSVLVCSNETHPLAIFGMFSQGPKVDAAVAQ